MRAFVWFVLCLYSLVTALKIINLGISNYPRTTDRVSDVIDSIFGMFLVAWACVLLFGG